MPVVAGLMGHMMNSVILGGVFAVIVKDREGGMLPLTGVGAVYGVAVFGIMWYLVVPLVDPVMLNLNPVVFAISHMMWGAALGLVLAWKETPLWASERGYAH